jgi:2-phosphoglycerate kinase
VTDLADVYWIGGAPGAGKTTVTRLLARRHGLRTYLTDDSMRDHDARSDPADVPLLTAFKAMSMDERWARRDPQTMLDTFHWFAGEAFDLILDDLRALPDGPAVVAEGFRLTPVRVRPIAAPGRSVWLLPSPQFRQATFDARGDRDGIPARTSDPARAAANLLERNRLLVDRLRAECAELDLPVLELDGSLDASGVTDRVEAMLGLR